MSRWQGSTAFRHTTTISLKARTLSQSWLRTWSLTIYLTGHEVGRSTRFHNPALLTKHNTTRYIELLSIVSAVTKHFEGPKPAPCAVR
jgi:hypothetical protein